MTFDPPNEGRTLGRRMFFKIENETGRDTCKFCKTALGPLVKHMATGLNICPSCIQFLQEKVDEPDEAGPMHQGVTYTLPPGLIDPGLFQPK